MSRKTHKKGPPKPFAYDIDDAEIRREREEARRLRNSTWWKRKLDKQTCSYCGKGCLPDELTMDHIVPLSRGGKSVKGNLAAACRECNIRKKQLFPTEWAEYLEQFRNRGNFS
jgi:5-methylcytosine-specific restriction endonuclease McrA